MRNRLSILILTLTTATVAHADPVPQQSTAYYSNLQEANATAQTYSYTPPPAQSAPVYQVTPVQPAPNPEPAPAKPVMMQLMDF